MGRLIGTMDKTESPIEIKTLDDARIALNRENGSFEEWLDCARIFSQNLDWPRLEMATEKAFTSIGNRDIGIINIREAATRFAAGSLSKVIKFEHLEIKSHETRSKLIHLKEQIPSDKKKQYEAIDSVIQVLDEVLLLLSDGTPEALVGVASRLRKRLGRPDLCIATANRVLAIQKDSAPARTTRGAAWTDLGRYEKALKDFEKAEMDKRGRIYALAGHSRLLICKGDFLEAFEVGSELLQTKVNKPILYMLAAAAKGAGLNEEFNRLVRIAEKLPGVTSKQGRLILTRKAIEFLIISKQFQLASEMILHLREFDKSRKPGDLEKLLRDERKIHESIASKNVVAQNTPT